LLTINYGIATLDDSTPAKMLFESTSIMQMFPEMAGRTAIFRDKGHLVFNTLLFRVYCRAIDTGCRPTLSEEDIKNGKQQGKVDWVRKFHVDH